MNRKLLVGYLLLILGALLLAGCATPVVEPAQPAEEPPRQSEPTAESGQIPNPAAVFCEEQGFSYQIRTAEAGDQAGVCLFADGSECDGWAYYNGDCGPGNAAELESVSEAVSDESVAESEPAGENETAGETGNEVVVTGWLGNVVTDQDDDLLSLSPEGAGVLGLTGTTPEIEDQIVALRDKQEPGKYAHFWGTLNCEAAEGTNCQLLVTQLRAGATFTEPEPVQAWEGTLVANAPGMQFDDYFLLAGRFSVGYGIHSLDPEIEAQLATLRDTGTILRVWGQLRTGVPDAFGSQIEVDRIEVQ